MEAEIYIHHLPAYSLIYPPKRITNHSASQIISYFFATIMFSFLILFYLTISPFLISDFFLKKNSMNTLDRNSMQFFA